MPCEALDILPNLARAALKGQLLHEVGGGHKRCYLRFLLFALAQLTVEDLALLIPPPPLLGEGGATTQGSESNTHTHTPPWSVLPEGGPLSLTSTSAVATPF